VVGETISKGLATDKKVSDSIRGEYGRVRATTFSQLVGTANLRLMKLRDRLKSRYGEMPTDSLLERVLGKPYQNNIPSE
jgi:hypothetical protein